MIIRKIEIKDSEKYLNMLKQLDNETTVDLSYRIGQLTIYILSRTR